MNATTASTKQTKSKRGNTDLKPSTVAAAGFVVHNGQNMRVVIASDKFKGSLTAAEACDAIARGVAAAVPDAVIDAVPIADGGEGTVDAVIRAAGGRIEHYDVGGPLPGMRVRAPVGFLPDGITAIVELATASGLLLIPPEQRDPTRTTTFGTGELLNYAVTRGARKVILGIGGSATCDAGLGIAQAWGAAVKTINGKVYAPSDRKLTGADVEKVLSISRFQPTFANYTGAPSQLQNDGRLLDTRDAEFIVACDVGNPLYGPDGAAHMFAPQKGATPEQVERLDAGLRKLVDRLGLHAHANAPGAGAAGGVGFAMMAFFGAKMVSGADLLIDLIGLKDRIGGADLVITGEGRFDAQSLHGKGPMAVAEVAKAMGKPCLVLAGSLGPGFEASYERGVTAALCINDGAIDLAEAMRRAPELLAHSAEAITRVIASATHGAA